LASMEPSDRYEGAGCDIRNDSNAFASWWARRRGQSFVRHNPGVALCGGSLTPAFKRRQPALDNRAGALAAGPPSWAGRRGQRGISRSEEAWAHSLRRCEMRR
jgi:hypothetical protein